MTATQAPTPGPMSATLSDPMERMVAEAFEAAGIGFKTDTACGLDFAIDGEPVFVEVKQFHTPRIAEQMARVDNVVAIQGRQAMSWFSSLVCRLAPTAPVEASGSEREPLHPHAQPFERYPELALHIERMAMSGVVGSGISWDAFLRELNKALRPQPSGETRPTDEEIRSAIKATEYKYFGDYEFTEDQHAAVDVLVRAGQALLSARPLALGGQHSGGEDFVVVPINPTEEMLKAGNQALSPWVAPAMHAGDAYQAMIAARHFGSRDYIAQRVFDCPELRGEFDMETARKVADFILSTTPARPLALGGQK